MLVLTPFEEFALGAYLNGFLTPADGAAWSVMERLAKRMQVRAALRGHMNAQASRAHLQALADGTIKSRLSDAPLQPDPTEEPK